MTGLIWAGTSQLTASSQPSVAATLAAKAIGEHLLSAYYGKWKSQNPKLGPAVDAYLKGGPRPLESLIGSNHYGRALVLTEDIKRNG